MEVLADFPNATPYIPFEYLFDLIPALQARAFSIASSQQVCIASSQQVHIHVYNSLITAGMEHCCLNPYYVLARYLKKTGRFYLNMLIKGDTN